MTQDPTNDGTEQTRADPLDQGRGPAYAPEPRSGWFVALPAVTLVLGIALGGLVTWAATDSGSTAGTTADAGIPTPSASTSQAGTAVVAPDSCLEAAQTLTDAFNEIQDGVAAIRDFEPSPLIDTLNRLEDLDQLARDQVASCQGTRLTDAPLPGDGSSSSAG